MIPTIEDILSDLAAGKITKEQAQKWIEEHLALSEEAARAAHPWTPVGEKLPDDDISVMVAMEGGEVWIGWHEGEGWLSADAVPIKVTHWMQIPEGPA